jgi:hypothetical protein
VIEPRILAEGARLLHIGFRKCGTTALQAALRNARDPLRSAGVRYPGTKFNHTLAALAITGRTHGWVSLGATPEPMGRWDQLVAEIAAIGPRERAVVSSEFFDVADEPAIKTIVDGLGGDQVQVLLTARPISKILPSAWQQQLRVGMRRSYDDWLHIILEGTDENKTHRTFWERHDQAGVLERWAGVIGPQRITLMVLDDSDRQLLYGGVETMLGVPEGTLREVPDRANRSMTGAEAELIRALNLEIFRHDISWDDYSKWIRRGAAQRIVTNRQPGADEPRIHTPPWALERADELGQEFVTRIGALQVNVVGNLQCLADVAAEPSAESEPEPSLVPIDVAVQAMLGMAFGTGTRSGGNADGWVPPRAGRLPSLGRIRSIGRRLLRRR